MDIRFFDQDRFAAMVGIKLLEMEPGRAVACLDIRPEHLNGAGIVQGGAIFTLADLAFAAAANAAGTLALGLAASISYIQAVSSGRLTATAQEISRRKRIGLYEVRVLAQDDLVATFNGTAYVTEKSLL
jgi:acyl-CoA thioesterase